MAGISDPTGFNFLTNLMNTVGTSATNAVNAKKPQGLKQMQNTFKGFDTPPATVLPCGGTLDQGVQTELAREEEPAATLPLYQGEQQNKIANAGVLGQTANLGAQQDILGQQYRAQLMSIIGPLLKQLGIPTGAANVTTGSGDVLMKVLSGAV